MTPDQLWAIIQPVGVGGLLAFALIGGARGWYVFKWVYDQVRKDLVDMTSDRNFWRDTALKSMGHVDKALGKDQ